jgi:hypothetical protein
MIKKRIDRIPLQDEINPGQVGVNMSVPLEIDPIPESPDIPTLGGDGGPVVADLGGEVIPTDPGDGGMVVTPPPPLTQIPQDGLLIWPNGNFVNAIYYQNYGNQLGEPFLFGVRLEDLDFEYSMVSLPAIESHPGLVGLWDFNGPLSLANPQPGSLGYFLVPEPATHAFLMLGMVVGWLGSRLRRRPQAG